MNEHGIEIAIQPFDHTFFIRYRVLSFHQHIPEAAYHLTGPQRTVADTFENRIKFKAECLTPERVELY